MRFYFLLIIFSLVSLSIYCQEKQTIYIDDGLRVVSKKNFEIKHKSSLYYALEFELDTVLYQKLYLKYFIGKLHDSVRTQLFPFIAQRYKIDTTKTMVIHYKDTLKTKTSYPKKDGIINLGDKGHKHVISYNTFIKGQFKCERKYARKNGIEVYHFFNQNEGHPTIYKDLKWHKDQLQMLRRLFYNNSNNSIYWHVTLHPNGDYFINNMGLDKKVYKDLENHRNWDMHRADFERRYLSLNPTHD